MLNCPGAPAAGSASTHGIPWHHMPATSSDAFLQQFSLQGSQIYNLDQCKLVSQYKISFFENF